MPFERIAADFTTTCQTDSGDMVVIAADISGQTSGAALQARSTAIPAVALASAVEIHGLPGSGGVALDFRTQPTSSDPVDDRGFIVPAGASVIGSQIGIHLASGSDDQVVNRGAVSRGQGIISHGMADGGIVEEEDAGRDTVVAGTNLALAANVEDPRLAGIEDLDGAVGDVLTGDLGGDRPRGRGGDDALVFTGDEDLLRGGGGRDLVDFSPLAAGATVSLAAAGATGSRAAAGATGSRAAWATT